MGYGVREQRPISFGALVGNAMRQTLTLPTILLSVAIVLVPVSYLASTVHSYLLRDHYDIFVLAMSSPFTLIFPLAVTFVVAGNDFRQLGHRYVSLTRTRVGVRKYLAAHLLAAMILGFVVFFVFSFLTFVVCYYVWPVLGDPSLNLRFYKLTPHQDTLDTYTRSTFAQFLRWGELPYGVFYSTWLGIWAAIYSAISIGALYLAKSRILAMAIPFLIYFLQTLAAELLIAPKIALTYIAFPFGLIQFSPIVPIVPTIVLGLLIALIWIGILRNVDRLANTS